MVFLGHLFLGVALNVNKPLSFIELRSFAALAI
jgi:hypothetical protein